jgi:hypothetical protein
MDDTYVDAFPSFFPPPHKNNAAANPVSIIIKRPKIRKIKNKNQEKKDMWINK